MKLDEKRLAFSLAGTTVVLWFVCSALVVLMPGMMGTLTGHMLHGNMEGFNWTMTWSGFFVGLVLWVVWAAAAGWLIARCYNCIGGSSDT
ncbi:MAG: hypothetical protein GXP15_16185 [Gammaproteobacteria bacterium]|nr:hypothetical protein [Gammaproteobacteria bacterium]